MSEPRRHSAPVVAGILVVLGVGMLMLAYCQTRVSWQLAPTEYELARMMMTKPQAGYSTGKECCQGECANKPTLAEQTLCCTQRCPQWADDCVDACIAGMPRNEVIAQISVAGRLLEKVESTETERTAGRKFLERMAEHDDAKHARHARALLKASGA